MNFQKHPKLLNAKNRIFRSYLYLFSFVMQKDGFHTGLGKPRKELSLIRRSCCLIIERVQSPWEGKFMPDIVHIPFIAIQLHFNKIEKHMSLDVQWVGLQLSCHLQSVSFRTNFSQLINLFTCYETRWTGP